MCHISKLAANFLVFAFLLIGTAGCEEQPAITYEEVVNVLGQTIEEFSQEVCPNCGTGVVPEYWGPGYTFQDPEELEDFFSNLGIPELSDLSGMGVGNCAMCYVGVCVYGVGVGYDDCTQVWDAYQRPIDCGLVGNGCTA